MVNIRIVWICIQIALLGTQLSSLDHEKSFLLQYGATSGYSVEVYKTSLLYTSSSDVVQKDIETGTIQRTFRAHSGLVFDFLVTEDNRMITTAWDDMIIFWDLETGSILRRIRFGAGNSMIQSISLQNNLLFLGGGAKIVRQVDLLSGRAVKTVNFVEKVLDVVTDRDFCYVGLEGFSLQLQKHSISSEVSLQIFVGHEDSVGCLLIIQDLLLSGSGDRKIIKWNKNDRTILGVFTGHTSLIFGILAIGDVLYSGGDDLVIFQWNITENRKLKTFPAQHVGIIWCFAHDSQSVFSSSVDNTIIRWNTSTAEPLFFFKGYSLKLRSMVIWRSFVITGGEDAQVSLWDKRQNSVSPSVILTGHTYGIYCMHIQGDSLFSGAEDATVREWDLASVTFNRSFLGHSDTIYAITVDQSFLFSGGREYVIKMWDLSSAEFVEDLRGHVGDIGDLLVRGPQLFSGAYDSTIRIWDIDTRTTVKLLSGFLEMEAVYLLEDAIIVGSYGIALVSIATGEIIASIQENPRCFSVVPAFSRFYSAHEDGLIKARDYGTLDSLETFQGHQDAVMILSLDESGVLFSASLDGSVKKWSMATRRVSFSFENRYGSVTSIIAIGNFLYVGQKSGEVNYFDIQTAKLLYGKSYHNGEVTSLATIQNQVYSSGSDGILIKLTHELVPSNITVFDGGNVPIKGLISFIDSILFIKGENEVYILPSTNSSERFKSFFAPSPLICLATTGPYIFAGSKSGLIYAWNTETIDLSYDLNGHTSQVNSLFATENSLYSASDDKTIVKWSLQAKISSLVLKRYSNSALGHLGSVNDLYICGGSLFSGGADITVRRWNIQTGSHDDVYFGFTKPVTSVFCQNRSVFAGSDDFAVLMYNPVFTGLDVTSSELSAAVTNGKKQTKFVRRTIGFGLDNNGFQLWAITVVICGFIVVSAFVAFRFFKAAAGRNTNTSSEKASRNDSSPTITDLATMVNSVMGLSKHAAFHIENSVVAPIQKIAAGGGGDIFLARVMTAFLTEKTGNLVIQKIVFVKNQTAQEAFYQEVGIMIMLSSFPNFCRIIAYTENPVSMILQYYPDGSLQGWIQNNKFGRDVMVKVSKEISSALRIMHSYYLAHCDIKTQNVLIEVVDGVPACFLTDFGITQVLSDKILASRAFNVINLRGLSVFYAAPEAFKCFRKKAYTGVDFKKFDVYSLACIVLELLSRKMPWG
ncbi:hypothetical protein MP638_002568 [Amoeboaphelidium occidentale]|nr:hypothetical protein MP638_002568 [Amoeboaphelidium occidentale]